MTVVKIFDCENASRDECRAKADEILTNMGAKNIIRLENGKPVAENLFVSISHSGGKFAVCASQNPIGIDIEKIADRDFDSIVKRIFGAKEKEYYSKNKSADAFYEIWTRKEAYSKILGDGIRDIIKGTDTFSLDGYEFKTQFQDGFVLTVCEKNI